MAPPPEPDPAADPPGIVAAAPADRPAVLVGVAHAVTSHADPGVLLRELAAALRDHLRVDYLSFSLLDPAVRAAKLQLLEPVGEAAPPDPDHVPTELPAGESPTAAVWDAQAPLWLSVAPGERRFPTLTAALRRQGVRAVCYVPLTTPRRRLGAMAFTSYRPVGATSGDVAFLTEIGRLVALAVEAALARRELEQANDRLARERDRLALLYETGEAVTAHLTPAGLLQAVTAGFRRLVDLQYAALWFPDPDGQHLWCPAIDVSGDDRHAPDDLVLPIARSETGRAFRTGRPVLLRGDDLARLTTALVLRLVARGAGAFYALPLGVGEKAVGVLSLIARDPGAFADDTAALLRQAARPVAVAVANAQEFQRAEKLAARLAEEKTYLEEEIWTEGQFGEIVGDSPALGAVFRQVEMVAPTDSAVLITGETGTGKELVARAVHRLSGRAGRTFVKLNCAAIPTGLLESELFGHEKGAFTGAVERRIGRFELADGGTLFLDEVGDIPPDLQPKLLRVLQEQEFERIGSGKTIKVDVRVVAATHRDLERLVAAGTFRADLFYRLHVFPIHLPPLRERREDIPALVQHFIHRFARRTGKDIREVPAEAMSWLRAYDWPGNVRELEHVIERAVILSRGPGLRIPRIEFVLPTGASPASPRVLPNTSLKEAERELIRRSLEQCGWVIGGPAGAAAKLGMKRTTLLARMKKLGLHRPSKN